ncbi:anti-sigma-D factor RsdA [Amycolatopsis vancoresmycina]|uniref:anti-sigma-D factor RsdA n=1 Tax=Amycolatopsis vancoresmycina TaxID=208444 RepID=UPI0030B7F752
MPGRPGRLRLGLGRVPDRAAPVSAQDEPVTALDEVDQLLSAMLAAWRRDIDSQPVRDFERQLLRGEHSAGHELSNR